MDAKTSLFPSLCKIYFDYSYHGILQFVGSWGNNQSLKKPGKAKLNIKEATIEAQADNHFDIKAGSIFLRESMITKPSKINLQDCDI